MGALKNQATGYSDEAAKYGFSDFESYKKANRGGMKSGVQYGASMAGTGAGIGSAIAPGIGTAIGAGVGALAGGVYGGITGNRQMKRDYLRYAEAMTKQAQERERMNQDANNAADLAAADARRRHEEMLANYQNQNYMGMQYMKKGGLNQTAVVNIEKGELLVDPKTGEILDVYHDAPKHPDGKHEIDLRGNREVPVGMAVIPAKMAEQYKSAKPEQRLEMIKTLPGFNGNPKAEGGVNLSAPSTYNWNQSPNYLDPTMSQVGYDMIRQEPMITPNVTYTSGLTQSAPQGLDQSAGQRTGGGGGSSWGAAAAYAPAAAMGIYQMVQGTRGLKALEKDPYARYNEEVQRENAMALKSAQGRATQAQERARYGLDPAQRAAYDQQIARDMNTRMQRAQDIAGGNASQAIGGILNANRIQAAQSIAAQDVQAMMAKQQAAERAAQYAEGIAQRIAAMRNAQQNLNTSFDQRLRMMKEQAYGQAVSQGMQNIINATGGFAASQYNPYVKQS